MWRPIARKIALCVLVLLVALPAQGQSVPAASPAAEPAAPAPDPLGRETPRGAVRGLLEALRRGDYEMAGQYISPPPGAGEATDGAAAAGAEVPPVDEPAAVDEPDAQAADADGAATDEAELVPLEPSGGAIIARRLRALLDQAGRLTPYNQLSADPEGVIADGLPLDVEQVGQFNGTPDLPILFVRRTDASGLQIWQLSQQTIAKLDSVVPPEVQDKLADKVEQADTGPQIFGAPLRDWLVLSAGAFAIFGFLWLCARALLWLLRRFVADEEANLFYRLAFAVLPPFSLLMMVVAIAYWSNNIDASIVARQALRDLTGVFGWAAVLWLALRLVDAGSRITAARIVRQGGGGSLSAVQLFRRAARAGIFLFGIVVIFDALGFDVTTGIAALGIGGLAIALGAQKLIENLVGGVSVVADKPVQIGDFCRVGDIIGTIEDIGMRSTRIRTLDKSLVTIPNADLASQRIENLSERDRFLFAPVIGMDYATPTAGLREAVRIIEGVLAEHPRIDHEATRVRLEAFGASSLDIKVFTYILVSDFVESRAIRHDILLAIHERLTAAGLRLALPTGRVRLLAEDEADTADPG